MLYSDPYKRNNMSAFILGLVAASLTTLAYIPQVAKTWKSKSSKDLSLKMLITFCVGITLWLIYGILEKDIPIIVANSVTLLLTFTLLFFKFKFKD
jgi:MtN3 and saliva related transmembrane protein